MRCSRAAVRMKSLRGTAPARVSRLVAPCSASEAPVPDIGCTVIDPQALLWAAVVAVAAWLLLAWLDRRRLRRATKQLIAHLRRAPDTPPCKRPRSMPESLFVVQLSESAVACTRPDGAVEKVSNAVTAKKSSRGEAMPFMRRTFSQTSRQGRRQVSRHRHRDGRIRDRCR
jgi:hypothetical protein